MTQIKLTPAQKSFIERFDAYTANGATPRDYRPLREEWRVQSRTMNWCYRAGLISKAANGNVGLYVINPDRRAELGLSPTRTIITKKLSPRKRLVRIFVG